MKYILKSLKHNGVYVPRYDYKGFAIKLQGRNIELTSKSEQMAIAWIRKTQSTLSPPDKVFLKNFMREFIEALKKENPSSEFLLSFSSEYSKTIENDDFVIPSNWIETSTFVGIDFSEISKHLAQEKAKKLNLTKSEKKKQAAQRKAKREERKEHFGYAFADGKKLEIANWTAEPSCLFAGRGDHPRRGKWKEGPREEDIILNISPDSPIPA